MAEKKFKAEIDFEGHIEPSVRESFEKFHEQLEGIQEKAAETTDTLKEMGEMATEFGIALLGIEEAKNVFDWLNESGKDLLATQIRINEELETLGRLQGKGPEGIVRMKEQLESFNEEMRKTSVYSRDAIEKIEAGLMMPSGEHNLRLNQKAIERLVPNILAAYQKSHPGQALEPEAAEEAGKSLAEWLIKGGRGSLDLFGTEVINKSQMADWFKKNFGTAGKGGKLGRPEVVTPDMAAAYLKYVIGGSGADIKELAAGKERPEAQPVEVTRSLTEMAAEIGASLNLAFDPLARMINVMLGGDPSGKNSPLTQLLDRLNEASRAFDDWVKSDFTKDWEGIKASIQDNVITPFNKFVNDTVKHPIIPAGFKQDLDPGADVVRICKDLGGIFNDIWKDLGGKDGVVAGLTTLSQLTFGTLETVLHGIADALDRIKAVIDVLPKWFNPEMLQYHAPGTITGVTTGFQRPAGEVAEQNRQTQEAAKAVGVDILQGFGNLFQGKGWGGEALPKATTFSGAPLPSGGGGGTYGQIPVPHAEGGIFDQPHVGMVGESGPEAIVPLSQSGDVIEQLFGWMGVQKHAEDTRAKLEKSEDSTQKMQELFATLPELTAQIVQEFQAMAQMSAAGLGLGSGYGGGGGMTEYGASVPGDQPGGPTYDYNSFHGIGAYTQHLVPGQDVAMHPEYAESHYHIRPLDFYVSDKDHMRHRWADVTGSKEFGNEDLYRGALGGLVTRPISALLGEAGPEAVIPLDRTPSSRQILEYAEAAMGRSGSGEGNIVNNFSPTIHISGGGEVGMGVAQALAHAQELFESAMEDILRRHRREMFA